MYANHIKRLCDLVLSFHILIFAFPFFGLVAFAIVLDSKGPIFFFQKRVGKHLVEFTLIKFRTMTHEGRTVGVKPIIGKATGVTRVGYILRRLKIDELPQLVNVLKGDMSLVGPRPSIPEQLAKMTEAEKQRYSVRPGLTGLAQVSGNIHLPWKQRFEYDLAYVNKISFQNDVRILLRTVVLLIVGEEKFKDKPLKLR